MSWKIEIEQRKIEAEMRRKKQLSEVAFVIVVSAVAVGAVIASWLHYN